MLGILGDEQAGEEEAEIVKGDIRRCLGRRFSLVIILFRVLKN